MPAEQTEETTQTAAVEFEEEVDDSVFDFSDDSEAPTDSKGTDADLKSFWNSLPADLAKLREDFLKENNGQPGAVPPPPSSGNPFSLPPIPPMKDGTPIGNIFGTPPPAKVEQPAEPAKAFTKDDYKLPDNIEAMLKKTAEDMSTKLFSDSDSTS